MTPEQNRQAQENALQTVMGLEQGRRFVMDVIEAAGWGLSPYAPQHGDLAYNVGRQDVGNTLFARVEASQPELARKMLAEWRERVDAMERELTKESEDAG